MTDHDAIARAAAVPCVVGDELYRLRMGDGSLLRVRQVVAGHPALEVIARISKGYALYKVDDDTSAFIEGAVMALPEAEVLRLNVPAS